MTLRVAITGVSGDVGRGAIQGLRENPPDAEPIWLLGLDAAADPPSGCLLDGFVQLPLVKDAGYVDALIATLQLHEIDVLLPGIDSEILTLSTARQRLRSTATRIVIAPSELVEAADDKLLTANYLSSRGIGAPATCDAESPTHIVFPLVAKPRRGHASRGIAILPDQHALQAFLATRPENYCLQRHIEGPEITVGFLYDSAGVMRDAIAMERTLENGRTIRARVSDDLPILQFVEDFGRKVSGVGAINAQLRWHEQDGPMVFEINARLSGSTEMRVAAGFNDPLRLARHFGRGTPIARAQPRKVTVYRSGTDLSVESC
jgi:carbamoyl-phosphate synthase large subunit